jgi:2'-5' RNA ligase
VGGAIEPTSHRLFLSVAVSEDASAAIDAALDRSSAGLDGARWLDPADRHVTVRFLGRVEPSSVSWLGRRLAALAARRSSFSISLAGTGAFPRRSAARVLWAGVDDPSGDLRRLAELVDEAVAPRFPGEGRPFVGHVTLARFRDARRLPPTVSAPIRSAPWTVRSLDLMHTIPGAGSPRYELMRAFPLGGRAGAG